MQFTPPGRFKTIEQFRDHVQSIDPSFECDLEVDAGGPLSTATRFGDRELSNRFVVHPMEGWDGTLEGGPGEHTLRRWRRFGESGAALVWGGEAFAVQADGRANPNQLCLRDDASTSADLSALLAALHDGCEDGDEPMVGLQLTHSGRFSRPGSGEMAPHVAVRHSILESKYPAAASAPVLDDDQLQIIRDEFLRAATIAASVGFEFVDIKCCHGYLLHELLGARSRPGRYGGDFEGRTRLLREIIESIRTTLPALRVGVRVSILDVQPHQADPDTRIGTPMGIEPGYGFGIDDGEWDEPGQLLQLLESLGVEAMNITIGSPYYCPHVQRPAAYPPSDGYLPPDDPLLGVLKHLEATRRCKELAPRMLVIGSGYSYLQEWMPHVAQHEVRAGHVDGIGLGRMMLSCPGLPRDVLAGRLPDRKLICRTFSDCTTAPRNGMISGCYPLDAHYTDMPQAQQVRVLRKEAARETDE